MPDVMVVRFALQRKSCFRKFDDSPKAGDVLHLQRRALCDICAELRRVNV